MFLDFQSFSLLFCYVFCFYMMLHFLNYCTLFDVVFPNLLVLKCTINLLSSQGICSNARYIIGLGFDPVIQLDFFFLIRIWIKHRNEAEFAQERLALFTWTPSPRHTVYLIHLSMTINFYYIWVCCLTRELCRASLLKNGASVSAPLWLCCPVRHYYRGAGLMWLCWWDSAGTCGLAPNQE